MVKKISLKNPIFPRKRLLGLVAILNFIGLFFIFEASSVRAYKDFSDPFYFVKLQLIWLIISSIIFFVTARFDYHKWYYLAFYLSLFSIFSLILVLIPGIGKKVGGAQRWISLGSFRFQPSEFTKAAMIIYLSSWFLYKERKRFFSFFIFLSFILFLLMLQPDMGTAILIFFLSIGIYFVAGLPISYFIGLISMAGILGILGIFMAPYRLRRLQAFLDPSADPLGIGYQLTQIQAALKKGGLFGQGLGFSQRKFLFLPESHTDSIFAIIGEEIGFIGLLFFLILYAYFIYLIFQISKNAKDRYGRILASGALLYFILHLIINLSGVLNLFPLTGMPIPFISYGGSNLLISFFILGIVYNISRNL